MGGGAQLAGLLRWVARCAEAEARVQAPTVAIGMIAAHRTSQQGMTQQGVPHLHNDQIVLGVVGVGAVHNYGGGQEGRAGGRARWSTGGAPARAQASRPWHRATEPAKRARHMEARSAAAMRSPLRTPAGRLGLVIPWSKRLTVRRRPCVDHHNGLAQVVHAGCAHHALPAGVGWRPGACMP